MNRILTVLILIILILISCKKEGKETKPTEAEPTFFTFSGLIGASDNSTIVSEDNNLIICGNLDNYVSVLKISKSGNKIWRSDFYAGNNGEAKSMTQTSNGDLFICGNTHKNHSDTIMDILLIKMNLSGDTIWTKTYGGNELDYCKNIITTSDENLLLVGKRDSFRAGLLKNIYLLKVNYSGDTLWTKKYSNTDYKVPYSLLETTDGGYLITGTNEDNSNLGGIYLLKVSSDGEKMWDQTIGEGSHKWGYSTIELSSGDFLTCGFHNNGRYNQVLVLKSDNQGNTIWEKEYGVGNLSEHGNSIKKNLDETITITGSCYNINTFSGDIIILKIDQDGNQDWFKKFGSSKSDWAINLVKDTNDDNIITGNSNGSIFMTKIDSKGGYK